jgi:hypothetical protein
VTDKVIDIRRYLGLDSGEGHGRAFAVQGGEGERTRFALPVWRAVSLVGGERGGIVSLRKGEREDSTPRQFFFLDLRRDPTDLALPFPLLQSLRNEPAPSMEMTEEGELAVVLGEEEGTVWFLQILGIGLEAAPEGRARETLLFLAGECAGLLFLRELSS